MGICGSQRRGKVPWYIYVQAFWWPDEGPGMASWEPYRLSDQQETKGGQTILEYSPFFANLYERKKMLVGEDCAVSGNSGFPQQQSRRSMEMAEWYQRMLGSGWLYSLITGSSGFVKDWPYGHRHRKELGTERRTKRAKVFWLSCC